MSSINELKPLNDLKINLTFKAAWRHELKFIFDNPNGGFFEPFGPEALRALN